MRIKHEGLWVAGLLAVLFFLGNGKLLVTDPVDSIGKFRTSEAFYLHKDIARLERAEDIDRLRPDGINWKAKNVMPFQAVESLPHGKFFYVLCQADEARKVNDLLPGAETENIARLGKRLVLRCRLPQEG